jgi:hypothetical protein
LILTDYIFDTWWFISSKRKILKRFRLWLQ